MELITGIAIFIIPCAILSFLINSYSNFLLYLIIGLFSIGILININNFLTLKDLIAKNTSLIGVVVLLGFIFILVKQK